jgi:Dynein heavy chain, N-terminal region 2/Hydrolytic ATP binding site of dynein motor region
MKFIGDNKRFFDKAADLFRIQLDGVNKNPKLWFFLNLLDSHNEEDRDGTKIKEKIVAGLTKINNLISDVIGFFPGLLKYVRDLCHRLHFFSDSQVLDILTSDKKGSEIVNSFLYIFPNISSMEISADENYIEGVTTKNNQQILFKKHISIYKSPEGSNFFIIKSINDLEKELKEYLRFNFSEDFKILLQYPYDFIKKYDLAKNIFFQIIRLAQDIQFYHDLSLLLATTQKNESEMDAEDLLQKIVLFNNMLVQNLRLLIDSKDSKKFVDRISYMKYCQFIFQIKYHIEIVEYLINTKQTSLNSFNYMVLPKPMIEYSTDKWEVSNEIMHNMVRSLDGKLQGMTTLNDFYNMSSEAEYLTHSTDKAVPYDVVIRSMNYKFTYGFDIDSLTNPIVYTPTTDRCMLTMLSAISTKSGVIMNGPKHIGKIETIKVQS